MPRIPFAKLNEEQVQNIVDDLITFKEMNINLQKSEGDDKQSYYKGKIDMIEQTIHHIKLCSGLIDVTFPSELRLSK